MISRYIARASTNLALNASKQMRMPRLVQTPVARFSKVDLSNAVLLQVEVEVEPEVQDHFINIIEANSSQSALTESGC